MFKVAMVDRYSREVLERYDEEFDSIEEAEDFANEREEGMVAGAEVADLSGEGYWDPDEVDFIIEEY